jgi:beta-lactamase superfamily II metal-dependent hydrolase
VSIVKSLSVGNGDMFYVNHNSDNFTMIDCSMSEENQDSIVEELKSNAKGKGVVRFISTHPDDDHICGLAHLCEQMNLPNFYCVKNGATKEDQTEDFDQYRTLRDDVKKAFYLYRGCSRKWMNLDSNAQDNDKRGNAGIQVIWPITSNDAYKDALEVGGSPNNISAILKYSLNGGATIVWMGDLETEFMEKIEDEITMDPADILFAPHHGRESGTVPAKWLEEMDPNLIIIGECPSEYLCYYPGYHTITQNSAGDMTFECISGKVHIYVSCDDYSVDFLDWEHVGDNHGGFYIGTLKTKS